MNQQENDFSQFVVSLADCTTPTGAAQVLHDPDGDCIEFVATDDDFYAERVDSLVTVYRERESEEIIGCLIKGVHAFLECLSEKLPGFRLEIVDQRIKLNMLFTAALWTSKPEGDDTESEGDGKTPVITYRKHERDVTYRKLREVAEKNQAEAELVPAG